MELKVHGQHIELTEALSEHIDTRFEAALGQFDRRVGEVQIRLEDVNGPKGGVDKRCHATIHLKPRGVVVIDELQEDMYAAVSVAADRAKQAVSRELDRRLDK